MATKLELFRDDFELTIEATLPLVVDEQPIVEFSKALFEVHGVTPLLIFDVVRSSIVPPVYSYHFVTVDDRQWKQTIDFVMYGDPDPHMSFDITRRWKLSELIPRRQLQVVTIQLINVYQLLSIKAEWRI